MKNKFLYTFFVVVCCSFMVFSQEVAVIKGEVYDEYLNPFSKAKVLSSEGITTITDGDGSFSIKVQVPTILKISYLGFSTETVKVTKPDQYVNIILKENTSLDQFIYSASKTNERLFEAPVSVEWISLNEIKRTPSLSFYESLENLKNIDIKTNSILLKSTNTRGFSTIENNRFVQLIDGADNVLPISNLSPGNLIGLVDADIEDVEVLTGASSALYGVNAFNGVLLINSKNPFDYQGISAKIQGGVTDQDSGINAFYNPSLRAAYKFDDNFAAKVSFSYYSGEEWHANDQRVIERAGDQVIQNSKGGESEYRNRVNSYGDEFTFNFKTTFLVASYLLSKESNRDNPEKLLDLAVRYPNQEITRDGYLESDLTDNKTNNLKFNTSFHYRPFGSEKFEIIWSSRLNTVKSLFQAGNVKFSMDNAQLNQHTLTFKGDSFVVRGYMNTSDAGNSYQLNALASLLNDEYNNPVEWFRLYASGFIDNRTGDNVIDFRDARSLANGNSIIPKSTLFNRKVNEFKSIPLAKQGALLEDYSRVYHADANFNFDKYIDFVEILVGGSYRRTKLDTRGSLFSDLDAPIFIDEFGIFSQFRKEFIDKRLKIASSIRYDKSQNYEGKFSPRVTASYALGKERKHNIRLALQTAFRQPKSLDQYLSAQTGVNKFSLGNLDENISRFNKRVIDVIKLKNLDINGGFAFKPAFTAKSFNEFYGASINKDVINDTSSYNNLITSARNNYNLLRTTELTRGLQPEQVTSLEFGYRAMIGLDETNVLELDFNAYFNDYQNFIYDKEVYIPLTEGANPIASRNVRTQYFDQNPFELAVFSVIARNHVTFVVPTNTTAGIQSYGLALGANTRLFNNYLLSANYTFNDFDYEESVDPDFETEFNIPKHSFKFTIGNPNVIENVGFNLATRWYDGYLYESEFADAYIDSRFVVDGQITYNLPSFKSKFRVGGNNLIGKPYYDNVGNGKVGSTYYFSWIIND